MNAKNKRLLVAGIASFFGAGMGTVAGNNEVWINMLVGMFGALVIVFLINGFVRD